MPTAMSPAPRQRAAAAPALDQRWAGAAAPDVDEPPTVRALGHDLVFVLLLRGRRHARWWRQAVRAMVAAWAGRWRCGAQVAVILLASCALAWLVWDSTEEQRQKDAPSARSAEGRLQGSLGDSDVTADLEARRSGAPAASGGRAEASSGTAADGSSSPLGGWFISFAAVSAVLLAGAGAAVLVVRRHSRLSGTPSEQVPVRALPELPELLPLDELEGQAGASDRSLPVADDEGRVIDVVDDGADRVHKDPLPLTLTAQPASSSTIGTTSSFTTTGSAFASTGLTGGDSALVVGEAAGSRIEARQRLYERRAAPRVDYVRPGVMVWRGAQCDISVRDLSVTGLRLRVPTPNPSPLPASTDYVQVEFPVEGGQVRVTAQVAWRRSTPEGVELGVVFRPMAAEDEERIRSTCMTLT